MKTAIIIHGWPDKEEYFDPRGPSSSNRNWFPWLQQQLLIKGILAQTPEMPDAWQPVYEKWKRVFERFEIDEDTILVGHSCGGGFLVRWLSENKVKAGKVVLVAPWLDPDHMIDRHFFDFVIDPSIASRTDGLFIFSSTDDDDDVLKSVDVLRQKLEQAQVIEFSDRGHFTRDDMGTDAFPELLETILE